MIVRLLTFHFPFLEYLISIHLIALTTFSLEIWLCNFCWHIACVVVEVLQKIDKKNQNLGFRSWQVWRAGADCCVGGWEAGGVEGRLPSPRLPLPGNRWWQPSTCPPPFPALTWLRDQLPSPGPPGPPGSPQSPEPPEPEEKREVHCQRPPLLMPSPGGSKGLASYCKAETTFTFHFSIINA